MSINGQYLLMQQKRKRVTSIKEVEQLQTRYNTLISSGRVTKADICQLVVPFRDKYSLTDLQALRIARSELKVTEINQLLIKGIIKNTETTIPYQMVCDNLVLNIWWYKAPNDKIMILMHVTEYDYQKNVTFSISQLKKGYSALRWLDEIASLDYYDYKKIKDSILNEVLTNTEYSLN